MTKLLKFILPFGIIFLIIFTYFGNIRIKKRNITIEDKNLPEAFDSYKIAHISDFHNTEWNGKIEEFLLEEDNLDGIFITGDLIDSRNPDFDLAFNFVKKLVEIAPTYYVSGNHELRLMEYEKFLKTLETLGVKIIENKAITIEKNGSEILIIGLGDVTGINRITSDENNSSRSDRVLKEINPPGNYYRILLSHRPELFQVYKDNNINLTFSGHAHGGQIVLPFIGPILAPNQGFFPDYTDGLYEEENSKLIVSKGLGNSSFPIRFNNNPDLIIVELKKPR